MPRQDAKSQWSSHVRQMLPAQLSKQDGQSRATSLLECKRYTGTNPLSTISGKANFYIKNLENDCLDGKDSDIFINPLMHEEESKSIMQGSRGAKENLSKRNNCTQRKENFEFLLCLVCVVSIPQWFSTRVLRNSIVF